MSLDYNKRNIAIAKTLRKNMTRQERHLWYDFLKDYPVRFQRQKAISDYIADFYCHEAKLVIELDGGQHYASEQAVQSDNERSKILEDMGLNVIRFTNIQIDKNFSDVCAAIYAAVKYRQEK